MKRIFVCLLLLACASCLSVDEEWAFAVTRTVWSEGTFSVPEPLVGGEDYAQADGEALAWLGAVLVGIPFAIDLVLLPITITHDYFYLD
jgi:hypothetical protein